MSGAVILFHSGNRSIDPKTKEGYDPWDAHILCGLRQLRLWNPTIPIYFIVDCDITQHIEELLKLNVEIVKVDDVLIERDISPMKQYFSGEQNPLWKTSLMRFFYIEQLMKSKNLTDVFTFDNDVLVYYNFEDFISSFRTLCGHIGITRIDQNGFVCGMMWIRDAHSMSALSDNLISLVGQKENQRTPECNLLHKAWLMGGDSLITPIPTWFSESQSTHWEQYGGIFDPATIGQMMGGCHNGSPPGTIMVHHGIGVRLRDFMEADGSIVKLEDNCGRRFYALSDGKDFICKINSIHLHCKQPRGFCDV